MADYYERLGVSRGATTEEIKRAYRKLARQLHPDVNGGDADAEARFRDITVAYETLADPERRARYDRFGPEGEAAFSGFGGNPFGGGGLGDLFEAFFASGSPFGGARGPAGPPAGVDVEAQVEVTFEEAVFGATKDVRVRTAVRCEECGGGGAKEGSTPQTCPECSGSGQIRRVRQSILGQMVSTGPCGRCGGVGEVITDPCPACAGEGRTLKNITLPVEVPAGVDNRMTLRLAGRGAVGPRGGPAGDLLVHVRVQPHERFERDGLDLRHRLGISFTQAVLGTELTYETLDGTETLRVEPGTQTGTTVRFRGHGVPDVHGRGRGDLHVELVVETPTDVDEEQESLLRQLAELRGEAVAPPGQGFFAKIRSAFR